AASGRNQLLSKQERLGDEARTEAERQAWPRRLTLAQSVQNEQQRWRRHVAALRQHLPRYGCGAFLQTESPFHGRDDARPAGMDGPARYVAEPKVVLPEPAFQPGPQ